MGRIEALEGAVQEIASQTALAEQMASQLGSSVQELLQTLFGL